MWQHTHKTLYIKPSSPKPIVSGWNNISVITLQFYSLHSWLILSVSWWKSSLPSILPNINKNVLASADHQVRYLLLLWFKYFGNILVFWAGDKSRACTRYAPQSHHNVPYHSDIIFKWQRQMQLSWVSTLTNKFPLGETLRFQARQLRNSELRAFHQQNFPLSAFVTGLYLIIWRTMM